MNLIIIGAPGSGKGTMSEMLIKQLEVIHISTGDILRAAVKENTNLGLEAKKYIDQGCLVPDDLVNDIIAERLSKGDLAKGFLLDGYPRTIKQVHAFEKILEKVKIKLDCVINLVINEKALTKRITGRRVCPNCKAIFHIETKKPKQDGICDHCNSELTIRKDDNEESLKIRLDAYHESTMPILEYYRKQNILVDIDADQAKELVLNDILKALHK